MTGLDQAFIKAYMQQSERAAATPLKPASSVSLDDALDDALEDRAKGDRARKDQAAHEAGETASAIPVDGVWEALEQPPPDAQPTPQDDGHDDGHDDGPPAAEPDSVSEPDSVAEHDSVAELDSIAGLTTTVPAFIRIDGLHASPKDDVDATAIPSAGEAFPPPNGQGPEPKSAPMVEEFGLAKVVHRIDSPDPAESAAGTEGRMVPPPHVKTTAADTKTDENNPAPTEAATDTEALTDTQMLTDTRALTGEEAPPGSNAASDAGETFRPMLQVDHFAWPKVCRGLDRAADDELNHLADALVAAMARGEKVLALGGCRLGEGTTTMLLCCGHRLAERGFQVVMVDANLADPKLAKRLGLLPQFGWEEVLAGRLPLEEVVIESTRSRLAILPLRKAFAGTGGPTDDENRAAESIDTLAAHYDLVLVDLGSLEDPEVVGGPLARGIASRLDAIVLVHNVHTTPQNHLDELQRHLAAANLTQMGVVQNFVRV